MFKDNHKNDEIADKSKSIDIIRRNELHTAPLSETSKGKRINYRYSVPDSVMLNMKKSAQRANEKMSKLYEKPVYKEESVTKIDFNDYFNKNLGDVSDDSQINSNLPDLLDK